MTVEVVRRRNPVKLEVKAGSIGIAKPSTGWVVLPEGVVVQGEDGEIIQPTGRFYVSVESFDPFHLLLDVGSGREGIFR